MSTWYVNSDSNNELIIFLRKQLGDNASQYTSWRYYTKFQNNFQWPLYMQNSRTFGLRLLFSGWN